MWRTLRTGEAVPEWTPRSYNMNTSRFMPTQFGEPYQKVCYIILFATLRRECKTKKKKKYVFFVIFFCFYFIVLYYPDGVKFHIIIILYVLHVYYEIHRKIDNFFFIFFTISENIPINNCSKNLSGDDNNNFKIQYTHTQYWRIRYMKLRINII